MNTTTMQETRSPERDLGAIRNLDYVILLCAQVPRMLAFYRDVLGFPVHREAWRGDWVELRVGSRLLTLRPRGWLQLDGRSVDGRASEGSAAVQLAFRVAPGEVGLWYSKLSASGVEIVQAPTDQPWGHRTLFFRDPEASLLEIYAEL